MSRISSASIEPDDLQLVDLRHHPKQTVIVAQTISKPAPKLGAVGKDARLQGLTSQADKAAFSQAVSRQTGRSTSGAAPKRKSAATNQNNGATPPPNLYEARARADVAAVNADRQNSGVNQSRGGGADDRMKRDVVLELSQVSGKSHPQSTWQYMKGTNAPTFEEAIKQGEAMKARFVMDSSVGAAQYVADVDAAVSDGAYNRSLIGDLERVADSY